jgi:ABC-2 type transport system ATP-binding protein
MINKVIQIDNVTKRYGDFTAIEDLSLDIGESSIFGLVGYNGAGKTTLLKTVAGIFCPDRGRVLIDGEDIFDSMDVRKRLFFVPDELYFIPHATILSMSKFYKGFYPKWNDQTVLKLAKLFGLDANTRISKFSKGMQRQVAIIMALSSYPKYLLLDELFDGLDPVIRNVVRKLLLEIIAETKTTVFVSSHNLRELEDLCDHIAVLNQKQIVYNNSVDNIKGNRFRCKAVFMQEPNKNVFSTINHHSLCINGKIATFIADEEETSINKKLDEMNSVLVENIPLTLEEILLEEMEVKEYDFKELFG